MASLDYPVGSRWVSWLYRGLDGRRVVKETICGLAQWFQWVYYCQRIYQKNKGKNRRILDNGYVTKFSKGTNFREFRRVTQIIF